MMVMEKEKRWELPLGKSGRDCFSSTKEVTIIMVPYERFSPFPKAVDELYKNVEMPFNLIIVEGNAPDIVRVALEKKQRQNGNITIIYSRHRPTISGAINLAMPHVKTPYAFIMDNGVGVPRGALKRLIECARESNAGIVLPKNFMLAESILESGEGETPLEDAGLRSCLLISREASLSLGRFDEDLDPFTVGIEIIMQARAKGIKICHEDSTCLECPDEGKICPIDTGLYSFRWSTQRALTSLKKLEERWGISLSEESYLDWVENKRRVLREANPLNSLSVLVSQIGAKILLAHKTAAGMFTGVPSAAEGRK